MKHEVFEGYVSEFGEYGYDFEPFFEVEYDDPTSILTIIHCVMIVHDGKASLVQDLEVGDHVRVVAKPIKGKKFIKRFVSINVFDDEEE